VGEATNGGDEAPARSASFNYRVDRIMQPIRRSPDLCTAHIPRVFRGATIVPQRAALVAFSGLLYGVMPCDQPAARWPRRLVAHACSVTPSVGVLHPVIDRETDARQLHRWPDRNAGAQTTT